MTMWILEVPDWLEAAEQTARERSLDPSERMGWVVALADRNVELGSGGPFGAAVFDLDSGDLVAAGVNLVESARTSVAHAEIVALVRAQDRLGTWDLSGAGSFELVTSVDPCAMCLGAIPWSGVRALRCAARGEDAEAIGFDEGTKPEAWEQRLAERGIRVEREIMREEARRVLRRYAEVGGTIYNPG